MALIPRLVNSILQRQSATLREPRRESESSSLSEDLKSESLSLREDPKGGTRNSLIEVQLRIVLSSRIWDNAALPDKGEGARQVAERTAIQDTDSPDLDRQFLAFCRSGRLAGAKGNLEAVRFLKEALEREGYTAHTLVDRGFALLPAVLGVGFLALAVAHFLTTRRFPFVILSSLMLAPMLKSAKSMRDGTPLAVFGVRPAAGESEAPTVILGAHFDSVSLLLIQGSFLAASLYAVVFMVGVFEVACLVSPLLAVLISAVTGFFLYGNASPGADDNASGVFAVLECARRLKSASNVNVVPVFFNYEEEGLFGSFAFTRRFVGKRGRGIPGVNIDPSKCFMINFDCVGRGKKIYISGDKGLAKMILDTSAARELGVSLTSSYPSDHLFFGKPWKALSFARADRCWMVNLSWIHSRADVPEKVTLNYIREVAFIVVEFVRSIGI